MDDAYKLVELCQDCGGWACVRMPAEPDLLLFCLPCYAYRRIRVLLQEGSLRFLPRRPYDAGSSADA